MRQRETTPFFHHDPCQWVSYASHWGLAFSLGFLSACFSQQSFATWPFLPQRLHFLCSGQFSARCLFFPQLKHVFILSISITLGPTLTKRAWNSQYMGQYRQLRIPPILGIGYLMDELERANAQAWISIEGCQQEHAMKWQTKDGVYQRNCRSQGWDTMELWSALTYIILESRGSESSAVGSWLNHCGEVVSPGMRSPQVKPAPWGPTFLVLFFWFGCLFCFLLPLVLRWFLLETTA